MPAKISLNNFSDGMVPDIDKSVRSKNSYDLAENLRYIADKYNNTGTLHSVESSANFSDDTIGIANTVILGHVKIRDYVVIFTTRWVSNSQRVDQIIRYDLTSAGLVNESIRWQGNDLYTDVPGASATVLPEYLSVVGRYEDADNVKVYWANSTKPIRMINIIETTSAYDQERLDLITTVEGSSAVLTDIISGELTSGRVDYAYSLIKENGQESSIINGLAGSAVNLYTDNISTSTTASVKGDLVSEVTGKGIKLTIDVSADDYSFFDKIRLYRIHYKEYAQIPEIIIVDDYNILNSGSNVILDIGGSTLGTLTAEEFAVISAVAYNAYTIEEKDNVLFAGNVTESFFDVDFDARAYRFSAAAGTQQANLYTGYSGYGSPEYEIDGTDPTSDAGSFTNWIDIPEVANAINAFNDLDNDTTTTYRYIYQSDGVTIGGEGPEVKYYFSTNSTSLDIDNPNTTSEPRTFSGYTNDSFYITNDYTSPIATYYFTGYQRDEVYRFGLVFYNAQGNKSNVKWIGDIRIPGPESEESDFYTISSNSSISPIFVNFTLDSLPTGAVSFEIVRSKREEVDRSILACGYISTTLDNSTATAPFTALKSRVPFVDPTAYDINSPGVAAAQTVNDRIVSFVTPESLFAEQVSMKDGDYLDIVGVYDTHVSTTEERERTAAGAVYPVDGAIIFENRYLSIKYKGLTLRDNVTSIDRYTLETVQYVEASETNTYYNFDQAAGGRLLNGGWINISVADKSLAPAGRTIALQTTAAIDISSYSGFDLPYVYIKRNNTGRYGGEDFQSRSQTKYISCSKIDSTLTVSGNKGDVYINHFDYMNYMYSTEYSDEYFATPGITDEEQCCADFVTFPVESKLNLSLRGDTDNFAKIYSSNSSYLVKEVAGLHVNSVTSEQYNQTNDLYLYNSVYSQENNISFSYPESDIDLRTDFDSRVVHSDKKFDDEYIDSWAKFRVNNFLDLESIHGPIKSLKKYNNTLYFAQDSSFGALSVNQRSLISDNNPGQLSLGTGDTLQRFDYINEYYGTQHKKSITANKGGIYFLDKDKRAMVNYNGKFEVLSDSKGFRTTMYNTTIIDVPFVVSSDLNSEVYWKFDGSNVYVNNNFTGNYIGRYTFSPHYIGDVETATFHNNTLADIYVYGLYTKDDDYGSFDEDIAGGVPVYNDSVLQITNNEEFFRTKAYDNLIFYTSSKLNDIERNTDKFDSVKYWNDYQYTEVTLTLGTTLESRERGYATAIPRNIVDVNGTTNIDIFSAGNQDTSRLFKERMRDKYITAELTYENSATKGQLSVPFIGFKYRNSVR